MAPRPTAIQAITPTTTATGIAYRPVRARCPVRSATRRRQTTVAPAAIAVINTIAAKRTLPPSNQNALAPCTLITAIGPRSHDSWRRGKDCSTTAVYISVSRMNSGMLRTNSTYARAALRTRKFFDRRATPSRMPRIVAAMMPKMTRRSVFCSPSTSASLTGWV